MHSQGVIFGDGLRPAAGVKAARWLVDRGDRKYPGCVGNLLPTHFESYVLVEPAPKQPEWWTAQREIMRNVAEVLADFTTTPDMSWYAVWEGHGFDSGGSLVVVGFGFTGENMTTEDRESADAHLRAMQAEQDRIQATVQAGLAEVPKFRLPHRTHYLFSGPLASIVNIRWPGEDRWFRPDLWWPDDRAWFVGTDVDFWCSYVGGTKAMTDALTARLPDLCQPTSLDDPLRIED